MTSHIPVLLQEIIDLTKPEPGMTIFDGTLGGGGYAKRFAHVVGKDGLVSGTDLDPLVTERLANESFGSKTAFFNKPFSAIADVARDLDVQFDIAVLDLGLSSDQLDSSGRGFSFKNREEPLDMSFAHAEQSDITAAEILNEWSEESIADILYGFGGERFSRRIARSVIEHRAETPFVNVGQLLDVIDDSVPHGYKRRKTHPATKTFQALRIATNSEWMHLDVFLKTVLDVVKPGGYIAIVSFHSGEDRKVKHTFRSWKDQELGTIINKKVVTPSETELKDNPRSRSALLRVFQKK